MSKWNIIIVVVSSLLTGCVFSERKDISENEMPFQGLNIDSIGVYQLEKEDYMILNDTFLNEEISQKISELRSKELVKDKGQHGATNIYNIQLLKEGNDLLVFINRTKEGGITIDFFEENKEDNFNYFLGTLYDSEEIHNLLEKKFRKVEIDN